MAQLTTIMNKTKNNISINYPSEWSDEYCTQIGRNIGLVSITEQQLIKQTPIAVLGVGGIGGPLAINLVRAGCENIIIADHDRIELSNLNRQPYESSDIGKLKIDALERKLKSINPMINIWKYSEISEENIGEILLNVKVIALTLDGPAGSILVAREALKRGIPMVEGWAVPLTFARWFTTKSVDYENCYGMATSSHTISEIMETPELMQHVYGKFIGFLKSLPNAIKDFSHNKDAFYLMMAGKIGLRSFAPIAKLISTYLTFEVLYAGVLRRKEKILAPRIYGFDFFRMEKIDLYL